MSAMDLSSIPNLPGYGFKRKQKNYHKPQTFNVVNGVRVEQQEGVTYEKPKLVTVPVMGNTRRTGSLPESTSAEQYKESVAGGQTQMPAWDALDRCVLRFYGFFKEAVVETNLENYRVRQCVILYYLEDDTCQVNLRKQDNSGMPQGQLIRRHRLPGPAGGYLGFQDLQVGMILPIYGRSIVLTGCDPFTRRFFADQGMEQDQDQPTEQDAWMQSRTQLAAKGATGNAAPRTHERLYREVELGGGHVNSDMQQFMEWDRKVCRFYAVMDDLSLPQFERRPFMILFFLADNTVEIREQYPLNCGRDNFPIFFRRSTLARGKAKVKSPLDPSERVEDNVAVTDFAVQAPIELQGQSFYIYDADDFTREYFATEIGVTLEPHQDVRLPDRAVPRPKTPPYTGYGSWDDSMGSVLQLVPKVPRKDFVKLFEHSGKVLRFMAQFANPTSEDHDRVFIVNFFLEDDTLSIHEPPQRNIGIVTGRFLEKGVHVNQLKDQLFQSDHLFVGAKIQVYNREFLLTDMDEYTRKFYEEGGAKRTFDLEAVLEKIREGFRQQYPLVRDIFRKFDADHDGVLTLKEFHDALKKWSFNVTEQEALMLMEHFDTKKDGQISYNEFCDQLLDEDYTTKMMNTKPPLKKDPNSSYAQKAYMRTEERAETQKVRQAYRKMSDVIYKSTGAFQKVFKEFSQQTHEPTVTSRQIMEALEHFGFSFDLEDVERVVLFAMGEDASLDKVNYVQFLQKMKTNFHDVPAER